jgi:hypothetical protein
MSRKQGPHSSMGMRPPAIATGRRQESLRDTVIPKEVAA